MTVASLDSPAATQRLASDAHITWAPSRPRPSTSPAAKSQQRLVNVEPFDVFKRDASDQSGPACKRTRCDGDSVLAFGSTASRTLGSQDTWSVEIAPEDIMDDYHLEEVEAQMAGEEESIEKNEIIMVE